MIFIIFLNSFKQFHRILYARLVYGHRLKTAFERTVLFNILSVLIKGSGSNNLKLSSGQSGLKHISGVHCSFAVSGSHEIVNLINKQKYVSRVFYLVYKGLHPAFKLTSKLCSGHKSGKIQKIYFLSPEPKGHVIIDKFLSNSLRDGSFSHTGLTNKARIVFGTTGKYLCYSVNFLFSAYNPIKLSPFCLCGKIRTESIQKFTLFICLFLFFFFIFHLLSTFFYTILTFAFWSGSTAE